MPSRAPKHLRITIWSETKGEFSPLFLQGGKMRENKVSIVAIVCGIIFLLAAGYFAVTMTMEKVSEPEKDYLIVGTNTPFPPFELKNNDRIVGLDIDLAERIAKAMGKKLIIKDFTEFDALLPMLQTGELDMVISAVTIREDRDEVVDFSDSYYDISQGILIKNGSNLNFSNPCNPEDFVGLRIAYQEGTTSQLWVEENLIGRVKISEPTVFDDFAFALQLLKLGAVDAILLDAPVAESFAKSNPDLVVAGTIETGEEYGVVVENGDPKNLLPAINKVIAEMKTSGEYQKLLEKWFGGGK